MESDYITQGYKLYKPVLKTGKVWGNLKVDNSQQYGHNREENSLDVE